MAETDIVVFYLRLAPLALDIDPVRRTRHNLVLSNRDFVVCATLKHDSARFELLKFTLFYFDISVDGYYPARERPIHTVALQFAGD